MNPFEMVAVIMIAVTIMTVARVKYGRHGRRDLPPQDQAETLRLREEVVQLKERLKVLERITVEKENSLAKEIESLRDR